MPRVAGLVVLTALLRRHRSSSAQVGGGGSIQGTVLDTSNAAVPGATVTATNVATGIGTTRQTTDAGVYAVTPLPPGQYRVTVTLDGFQTYVRDGIIVDALSVVGLNVTLQVGAISQEVVVSATPPSLATADARLGQTIRNEVYTALPLVMNTGGPRDPTAFMFLMPGVQSVGRWGNVMGGQDFTTDMYVEGIPITNAVVQGEGRNLSFGFSVEAIDQFQVETSGTAVMFNGQGASNYVVKSGTNTFRGARIRVLPEQGARRQGILCDRQARRQPARIRGHARRSDPQEPDVLLHGVRRVPRSPADALVADVDSNAGGAPRRFQRAAGADLRSANDAAESQRHRVRARSLPGQYHPGRSPLADLALLPVVPARSDQRRPAEQLSRRVAADRLQQRKRHGKSGPEAEYAAADVGAVLARQAQPGHAVPRRQSGDESSDRLAAAVPETRLVEEVPTSAQIKHTYVLGSKWVNQASVGFSRLSVPIFNATIDGQYPIKAGLRGLPAGEADSSFPEITFAGPNAPTQWRGTDARAFTEYLNNYTLQNNLNWIHGKHAMTFGLQAQRMDADERERTYGSQATFGFSNVQTAGFTPAGTLLPATGNAYASFLLGDLNATNVIQDSQVATSGRFYTYAFWAQDDFKLRPNLTLNLGLRYDIMKPYTEVHDRWSFLDPTLPNPAVGGYPGAIVFAGDGVNSCQLPDADRHLSWGDRTTRRGGVQPERSHGPAGGVRHQLFPPRRRRRARRRAQRHRNTRLLCQRELPERERLRSRVQLEQRRAVLSAAAVLRSDPQRRLRGGPRNRRHRHLRRSRDRRTAASLPELEWRPSVRARTDAHGRRDIRREPRRLPRFLQRQRARVLRESARSALPRAGQPADAAGGARQHRCRTGDRARRGPAVPDFSGTIAQMLRPFPQYSGVTDVYGNVARSTYHSLQLTAEKRRSDDGLIVNFNYTFSRTEDNLATRTAYNIDQEWAVGVNDQPHVWNALVVYNLPFGEEGKPGSGNAVVRAIVKDWQLSGITQFRSGRPLGSFSPPAICRMPARATPISTRPSPATSASTATMATATSLAPTRRPTSTAPRFSRRRRSPTATRRGPSPSIYAIRAPSTRISACAGISPSPG